MSGPATGQRRTTYREVFSQPRFRLLFYAMGTGVAAHALQIMALSVLVYRQTGSPLLGAVTFGIGFLPQAFGGTLLGAVADRMRPRRLIVAGYAVEGAAAAVLALVDMPVAAKLALVAAVGCLTPLYLGACNRLIADVFVPPGRNAADDQDAYVLARSVVQATASGAQLLGLAVGGTAVAAWGAQNALLVTAGAFLLACLLIRIRLPDLDAPAGPAGEYQRHSVLARSWTVNRALLAAPEVRRLLLIQWLPPACAASAESLLVPYANERQFPSGTAGLLLASLPVGMLLGDFVVGRFLAPATRERLTPWLVLLLGSPLIMFSFEPGLVISSALLTLSGFGFGYALGIERRFLDAVATKSRGQAFTLRSSGLMTAQGIGPAVFGALAQFTSVSAAITLAGAAAVLTVGLLRR